VAQAILLQDVERLGERGTVVDVSPGYLRNYLVPRKLAQPATPAALEAARARHEAQERAHQEAAERARETAALLTRAGGRPRGGRGPGAGRIRLARLSRSAAGVGRPLPRSGL
jgi:Ribosomal protein L9, N-terminal domain